MNWSVLLFLLSLFTGSSWFATAHENYASVLSEQLNQYCDLHNRCPSSTENSRRHVPQIGKAGPRGLPGVAGIPGVVNYTVVGKMVQSKIAESDLEQRIITLTEKLASLEKAFSKQHKKDCSMASHTDAQIRNTTGGVFEIYPGTSGRMMTVYCDLTTDGGPWIVFQRRMDGSENFERNWADYVAGFGKLEGEFWLGLEKIHRLTSQGSYEMRVDLEDWEGVKLYALYTTFSIGDAAHNYAIHIGGYSGTAGDSLAYHNGARFFTIDQDNGNSGARKYKGGWWYRNGYYSNLNGLYIKDGSYKASHPHGIEWWHSRNVHFYSFKFAEMKIRPKY